ncbi:MAG: flavin monoamine oxidase family protein [Bacteroidota bacterium]
MNRREFIRRAALASGSAFTVMHGLGLLPAAPLSAIPDTASLKKGKVLILGGGLAGLTTAYELQKLGIDCEVLEARNRPGGRLWTVRGGDQEQELGYENQQCAFDAGQYMNVGPARIPHHHEVSLHYVREMGLSVEIFANFNEAAFFYSQAKGPLANRRHRMREIKTDLRGYTTELLAKAIHQDSLDLPMSPRDVEKLLTYLKEEGGLNEDFIYQGGERRGYTQQPGAAGQKGEIADPNQLRAILYSGLTHPAFSGVGEYTYHQQPTMLQIVGGMDQLATSIYEKVKPLVQLQAEIQEVKRKGKGVEVVYKNAEGKLKKAKGDYCVVSLPVPILRKLKHDFDPRMQAAFEDISYIDTTKVAFQFNRRFWEEDDHIYGGISKTNMDITQIFYPSYGYLSPKGVLIGCYNFHQRARKMGDMTPADRIQHAFKQGQKIHPAYADHLDNAFTVAWQKIPYSEGGWATYTEAQRAGLYQEFGKRDGPYLFIGEHTTYLNAWMAGAFTSARRAVNLIHEDLNQP